MCRYEGAACDRDIVVQEAADNARNSSCTHDSQNRRRPSTERQILIVIANLCVPCACQNVLCRPCVDFTASHFFTLRMFVRLSLMLYDLAVYAVLVNIPVQLVWLAIVH